MQVLNAALTGCARAAKWQLCLQLMQSAMCNGSTPDVATFGIAISALERGRVFWGRALSLLAESQRGSLNRTSVYNAAISAVGAAGRWRMSLRLLQSMRDHGQARTPFDLKLSLVLWGLPGSSWLPGPGRSQTPAASTRVCQCHGCSMLQLCRQSSTEPAVDEILAEACERAWQWEQCLQVLWDAGPSADAASTLAGEIFKAAQPALADSAVMCRVWKLEAIPSWRPPSSRQGSGKRRFSFCERCPTCRCRHGEFG